MNISDVIAQAIQELLDKQGGSAQIKRNELAGKLGCVPSQINYVITSRFTPEQGYIVESKRGGGGFIRIVRVTHSKQALFMHIINSIGEQIDEYSVRIILQHLCYDHLIHEKEAKIIASALGDHILRAIPTPATRDSVRAAMFKNMLLSCM